MKIITVVNKRVQEPVISWKQTLSILDPLHPK